MGIERHLRQRHLCVDPGPLGGGAHSSELGCGCPDLIIDKYLTSCARGVLVSEIRVSLPSVSSDNLLRHFVGQQDLDVPFLLGIFSSVALVNSSYCLASMPPREQHLKQIVCTWLPSLLALHSGVIWASLCGKDVHFS